MLSASQCVLIAPTFASSKEGLFVQRDRHHYHQKGNFSLTVHSVHRGSFHLSWSPAPFASAAAGGPDRHRQDQRVLRRLPLSLTTRTTNPTTCSSSASTSSTFASTQNTRFTTGMRGLSTKLSPTSLPPPCGTGQLIPLETLGAIPLSILPFTGRSDSLLPCCSDTTTTS